MPSLTIGLGVAQEVATGAGGATFTNHGPATVSYSDAPSVRELPEGSIAPGASVTLYGSVWLYAASRADASYVLLEAATTGLPAGGDAGDVLTNVAPGTGAWSPPVESGSGLPSTIRPLTANATAVDGDFILADATGGSFTITLPATGTCTVKKIDASANAVAVAAGGGGTIDGDAGGVSITAENFGAVFQSTASNVWKIVGVTASGADGADGADGATGPAGPTGPAGLTWQGAWVSGTTYAVNDAVSNAGSSYRRLIAGAGATAPGSDPTNWAVLAAKGDAGATGSTGSAGANGQGVPTGGTTGQVLAKTSGTDYATGWTTPSGGSSTPPNTPVPADNNMKLWSFDLAMANTGFTPTAGVVYLMKMPIHDAQTLSKLWYAVNQALAGGGGGAANLFFGYYALLSAGTLTLIGKSTDQVSAMSGVAADRYGFTVTAEAGQTLALDGTKPVCGAVLIGTQGSTTFQGTRAGGQANAGLVVGTDLLRAGKSGTGQSALPATIAVSGMTSDLLQWMGGS